MIGISQETHINRRLSPHPLRKALAITACAFAGLLGLATVPAAAAQAAAGTPTAAPPNQAPRSTVALAFDPAGAGFAFYRGADTAVYLRTFRSNGGFVLVRGTDNALWGNGIGGGGSTGWRKIGSRLITDSPAAAGTREPAPHMIAAVIGTDHAVWTTMYPVSNGSWSAFTRAWVPEG